MFSTTHMQRAIVNLKNHLIELGAEVERSLERAHDVLVSMDVEAAREVVLYDNKIDNHEVEIEEEGLKILALYQPVSSDLRFVVAMLKINGDLERMADLAANIAGYVPEIVQRVGPVEISGKFLLMSNETREMVRKCLDAFVNEDAKLAHDVFQQDDKVDDLNVEIIDECLEMMKEDTDKMEALMFLVSASRNIERIADIATNIAEDIIYLVSGEIMRHKCWKR